MSITVKENEPIRAPKIQLDEENPGIISFDGDCREDGEKALRKCLGTQNEDCVTGLLVQIIHITKNKDTFNQVNMNFAIGFIADLKPQNLIETTLAIQMFAVHASIITVARRLDICPTIDQMNSYSNVYNKLSRTYTAQLEALRKLRNGGEQKVTAQHVQVNEGGQAVVGNVKHGGGNIES